MGSKRIFASGVKQVQTPVVGQPLLELTGDGRLLIEYHDGIANYGLTEIHVKVKFGTIQIRGGSLRLDHLSKERLLICGRIDCIQLCRRCASK